MSWWEETGRPFIQQPEIAGAVGALMSLKWAPGNAWSTRFFAFGTGLGMAAFLSPYVIEEMNITSKFGPGAFAFLLGLFGLNLIAKAIETIKSMTVDDLRNWLFSALGGKRDQ